MKKIKVKDILEVFDDGNYTNIDAITVATQDGEHPLMKCTFRSWGNIASHILERNVFNCAVCVFQGDITLKIYVEE